jgi:hypothetical protein
VTAPVSGPGRFSRRTDGTASQQQPVRDVTGLPYGDGEAIRTQQSSAPMAAAPSPADAAPEDLGPVAPMPPSLSDPTQRPGEPVTSGAALGPGAGVGALFAGRAGRPAGAGDITRAINTIAASDPSGVLARLAIEAQRRGL